MQLAPGRIPVELLIKTANYMIVVGEANCNLIKIAVYLLIS